MESELLPCPFCGGINIVMIPDYGEEDFYLECQSCKFARMPSWGTIGYLTEQDAIKAWNTRKQIAG